MPKYIAAALPVVLLALLQACGGGGSEGSGTDRTGGLSGLLAIDNYTPVVTKPSLTKVDQRASISYDEGLNWLETFYTMTSILYAVSDIDSGAVRPAFLGDRANDELLNTSCERGQLQLDEYDNTFVGTFNGCQANDVTLNGQLVVTADPDRGKVDVRYRYFQMKSPEVELIVHGDLFVDEIGVSATDLYYRNVTLGRTYYTEELELISGQVFGYIYADNTGYIFAGSESGGNFIELNGEGSSRQVARVKYNSSDWFFEAKLVDTEGVRYNTNINLETLLSRAYQPNGAPILDEAPIRTVVEGELLEFTVDVSDPDSDYLRYEWQYGSGPTGCASPEVTGGGNSVQVQALCRGEHQLDLTLSDGRDTYRYQVPYQVTAPAPELSEEIARVTVTSEGVQAQLQVVSPEEHGPFSYHIESPRSGVSVDDQGVIRVDNPERVINTPGGEITVTGTVSNETATPFTLAIPLRQDTAVMLPAYLGPLNLDKPWADWNQNGLPDQLISFGQSFAIVEMAETGLQVIHTETRELSDGLLRHFDTMDTNGDGQQEIVLAFEYELVVLSGEDFQVLKRQAWEDGQGEPVELLQSRDVVFAPDGRAEIHYRGYQKGFYAVAMRYQFIADQFEPILEQDFQDTVIAQGRTLADLDGTGILSRAEVVAVEGSDHQFSVHQYDPDDPERLVRTRTLELPADERWHAKEISFMSMDGETGHELVAATWDGTLRVFKPVDEGFELAAVLELEGESWIISRNQLVPYDGQSAALHVGNGLYRLSVERGVELLPLNRASFRPAFNFTYYLLDADEGGQLTLVSDEQNAARENGLTRFVLDDNLETVERQWFNTPLLYTHGGAAAIPALSGEHNNLIYRSGSIGGVIWDSQTGQTIEEGFMSVERPQAGDLDGDGRAEVYGTNGSRLVWADPDTYQTHILEDMDPYQLGPFRFLVMDGIDTPQLVVIGRSGVSDTRVLIYRYNEEGVLALHSDQVLQTELSVASLAQQDVTGDGQPEIILHDSLLYDREAFKVFDKDFQLLMDFELSGLVRPRAFNLSGVRSNRLLVFEEGRIVTINPEKQRIEDRSQRFEGTIKPNSLLCHGENLMTCPKTLLTSGAIYRYPGAMTEH